MRSLLWGTNNARLAQMERQLACYYHKESDCLFVVRIAQGLVHMGKGAIGINQFYLDRAILNKPAVAGLIATLTEFTDTKALMYPRRMRALSCILTPFPVRRCRETSGQVVDYLWLPNLSDTRPTGDHGTCGARNGRTHPICEWVGSVRLAAEEPWLGEDGVVTCIDTVPPMLNSLETIRLVAGLGLIVDLRGGQS